MLINNFPRSPRIQLLQVATQSPNMINSINLILKNNVFIRISKFTFFVANELPDRQHRAETTKYRQSKNIQAKNYR